MPKPRPFRAGFRPHAARSPKASRSFLSCGLGNRRNAQSACERFPFPHGAHALVFRSLARAADGTGGGAGLPLVPTVSSQPAYLSGRPPPWPPIEERQTLRSPPFFKRRLHPRPTGCFSISHPGDGRAHWAPPRRFAEASTSRPASLHVGPQSAHLCRAAGLRPPVFAFPRAPAPDGTNRRRDFFRPLKRSPRKRVPGLLQTPGPTIRASPHPRSFSSVK